MQEKNLTGLTQVAFWLEWPTSVLLKPFQKQHCYLWLGASGRGLGAWGLAQAAGRTGWTLQRTYPTTSSPGRTSASSGAPHKNTLSCSLCSSWKWRRSLVQRASVRGLDQAVLWVWRWPGGLNVPAFSSILSSLHVSFYCFWKYSSCFLLVVLMSNI